MWHWKLIAAIKVSAKHSWRLSDTLTRGQCNICTKLLTKAIFVSLAEYDRESILEKTKAGQQLAAAQGKHIGWPKGLDAENLAKARKALEKELSVAETVELTGISLSSVKRYRKHLQATFT